LATVAYVNAETFFQKDLFPGKELIVDKIKSMC